MVECFFPAFFFSLLVELYQKCHRHSYKVEFFLAAKSNNPSHERNQFATLVTLYNYNF